MSKEVNIIESGKSAAFSPLCAGYVPDARTEGCIVNPIICVGHVSLASGGCPC